MTQHEFGVIGAGNIAEALLRGVMDAELLRPDVVVASEPNADRRRHISQSLGIECVEDNTVPAKCNKVLLAVKPQVLPAAAKEIAPLILPGTLVISIAAGISTALIDRLLGGRGRIIRVMPNMGLLVGAGISAVAAGPRARGEDVTYVAELFAACGKSLLVTEEQMDAVTAVSGSGPAYVFYLAEAMAQAGVAEGLDERTAAELVARTIDGAAKLLTMTSAGPAELRAKVTSPNGTTQRAIETMQAGAVFETLVAAIRAAAARSRELGQAAEQQK